MYDSLDQPQEQMLNSKEVLSHSKKSTTLQLASDQLGYFQWAIYDQPIIPNIQGTKVRDAVQELQELSKGDPAAFWSKISRLVDLLQHTATLTESLYVPKPEPVSTQKNARPRQLAFKPKPSSYPGAPPTNIIPERPPLLSQRNTLEDILHSLNQYKLEPSACKGLALQLDSWISGSKETSPVDQIEKLVSKDGLGILANVMRANFDSEVQRRLLCILTTCVQYRSNCAAEWISSGGLGPLVQTMKRMGDDQDVQEWGLGVLASPSVSSDSVVRMNYVEVCDVVLAVLNRFTKSGRIQALGFLSLGNLAVKDDRNIRLLMSNRVEYLVLDRLQDRYRMDDRHLMASGLWLLETMTAESTLDAEERFHLLQRILEVDGAATIEQLVSVHVGQTSVQQYGSVLLARLSSASKGRKSFVEKEIATDPENRLEDDSCIVQ